MKIVFISDTHGEHIKPKIHAFGHIHPSHGTYKCPKTGVISVNAAICNDWHDVVNQPIVIDLT